MIRDDRQDKEYIYTGAYGVKPAPLIKQDTVWYRLWAPRKTLITLSSLFPAANSEALRYKNSAALPDFLFCHSGSVRARGKPLHSIEFTCGAVRSVTLIQVAAETEDMKTDGKGDKLDKIVADARASYESRESGYRQRALKLFPWVCGRCMREFDRNNLRELTVHHRDHDHDNNPLDGSNWELLCVFCHDNEHQRLVENTTSGTDKLAPEATHNPFADLQQLINKSDDRE